MMWGHDGFKIWAVFCISGGLIGAIISLALGPMAGEAAVKRILNVPQAFAFHDLRIVNPILRSGDAPVLGFGYSKREDCSPPLGEGEFIFKVYSGESVQRLEKGLSFDKLPSGVDQPFVKRAIPDFPRLEPGSYELGLRGVFVCEHERDPQIITPEKKLAFEVIP